MNEKKHIGESEGSKREREGEREREREMVSYVLITRRKRNLNKKLTRN